MATTDIIEKRERRRARERSLRTERASRKKVAENESRALMHKIRNILQDCGLSIKQISQFSGLEFSTVNKVMLGYDKAVNIQSFLALLKTAGYVMRIEEIDPRKDEFRSHRRLPPPALE